MARFLSQVYTTIRGSVGGDTYTANQWHPLIVRARVAPVNPSTPNQSVIRSSLAQVSGAWKQLTDLQRDAWDAYASTCEFSGPLGNYTVPGRQMMVAVLTIARYINTRGLAVLTVIPTPPTIPGFYSPGPVVDASNTPGQIDISITNQTGVDGYALVERSFAFNPSRYRYKGPFDSGSAQAVAIPSGASTNVTFDDLEEGYVYFTRIRMITDEAPFRMSAQYILRSICPVTP